MDDRPADDLERLRAENRRLRRRVAELERAGSDDGREKAQEALRLLEAVMEAIPGTIHVKDRDDRYLFVNRYFLESWGVTREHCIGKRPQDVFPQYGPAVAERDRRVIETRRALPYYEVEYPPRNGEPVVVLSTKLPLFDDEGEVSHILTIGLDISSIKAAESRQRATEALMGAVVQASADAILIADADDLVLEFNPAAEALFGRPRDAVAGRPLADLVGPDAAGFVHRATGRPERSERDLTRSGEPFPAEVTTVRVTLETGDAVIATIRDLTERRESERRFAEQQQALHQREKMGALGSLLAGVAHELNNPLSVVLAQALLLGEAAGDPALAARGRKIYDAADRCARTVRSFLAIARQRPPAYAPLRIRQVIDAALAVTTYGLQSSGVELRLDIPEDLPPVRGDADQLSQVFMNLFVNAQQALQAIPEPRRLAVTARADEDALVVRVADNGPGIPPQVRSRIFDPFFTTKPVGVGTGVGLSICLGIAAAHGGSLTLEGAGEGATFLLRLPVAPEAEAAATAPAVRRAPAGRARAILVVDDEPEIAELIAEIVGPLADRVDLAANGLEALEATTTTTYDLVISDLRMPGLDGPGLFRRLRAGSAPYTGSVLFVTGDTLHHNLEHFLVETGAPVIEKPFEPADIRHKVAELLAAPARAPAGA
jgi:PAS domain S-box-containing protein